MNNQIRESIVEFATSHIGLTESPSFSNRIKYNDWYYNDKHPYHTTWKEGLTYTIRNDQKLGLVFDFGNGVIYVSKRYPYCATGVSYWYFFGGFPLPKIDTPEGFCSVPNLYKLAITNDWLTEDPKKGDIAIIDFGSNGGIDHTGLFMEWVIKGESYWCMESNTSSTEKGSQDRGGGDFKRVRYINSHGMKSYFANLIDNIK